MEAFEGPSWTQDLLVVGDEAVELVLVRVVELLYDVVLLEAALFEAVLVEGDHALLLLSLIHI